MSEFCAETLGDSDPMSPRLYKLRMESAMMRAVRFWYPPEVTMRMGTWRPRTTRNTSSSRFTMPCGGKGEADSGGRPGPRGFRKSRCDRRCFRPLSLLHTPPPCTPLRAGTHLGADGQPPKAVALKDVGACIVHDHVRQVLLEGFLEVPLHFIQVLVVLRAPLQLHLPPDGL